MTDNWIDRLRDDNFVIGYWGIRIIDSSLTISIVRDVRDLEQFQNLSLKHVIDFVLLIRIKRGS